MLELRKVSKSYRGIPAVENVSFLLRPVRFWDIWVPTVRVNLRLSRW